MTKKKPQSAQEEGRLAAMEAEKIASGGARERRLFARGTLLKVIFVRRWTKRRRSASRSRLGGARVPVAGALTRSILGRRRRARTRATSAGRRVVASSRRTRTRTACCGILRTEPPTRSRRSSAKGASLGCVPPTSDRRDGDVRRSSDGAFADRGFDGGDPRSYWSSRLRGT